MKSNGFQAFKINRGELQIHGEPKRYSSDIEETIKIPKDLMGDATYVILPVYTNKLPMVEE